MSNNHLMMRDKQYLEGMGNYDKYNAMLINRGNNSDQFINANIGGYTIKSTPDLKLLGLHWMISLNSVNM